MLGPVLFAVVLVLVWFGLLTLIPMPKPPALSWTMPDGLTEADRLWVQDNLTNRIGLPAPAPTVKALTSTPHAPYAEPTRKAIEAQAQTIKDAARDREAARRAWTASRVFVPLGGEYDRTVTYQQRQMLAAQRLAPTILRPTSFIDTRRCERCGRTYLDHPARGCQRFTTTLPPECACEVCDRAHSTQRTTDDRVSREMDDSLDL